MSPVLCAASIVLTSPTALIAQSADAPSPTSAPPAGGDTQITTRVDATARLTVPVSVNGSGPFRFLVDTGANRTVVSDRLALALHLPARPNAQMVEVTGVEDVAMAALGSLEVGGIRHDSFDAVVLAEAPLGATGVLGIDNLVDRRVVLDFRHQHMLVSGQERSADPADHDPPGTIVVVARRKSGQLILTDAYYRNHRIDVVLDTGAEVSIGNLAFLDLIRRKRGELPTSTVTSVTGRQAPVSLAVLPEVRLGSMSLSNSSIAFADVACFARFGLAKRPAMLLGMDVLRHFDRVAIDFKRRQVSFSVPRDSNQGPVVSLGYS